MPLGTRLYIIMIHIIGFCTGTKPVYVRNGNEVWLRLARKRYDPWTDEISLWAKIPGGGTCQLKNDGKVSEYSSVRWMYVNRSLRTLQKLQHG